VPEKLDNEDLEETFESCADKTWAIDGRRGSMDGLRELFESGDNDTELPRRGPTGLSEAS